MASASTTTAEEVQSSDEESESVLKLGQSCFADWHLFGTWYPGTITKVREGGMYDVKYTDGDFEAKVARKNLQTMGAYCFVCLMICMFVCLLVCIHVRVTLTHSFTPAHISAVEHKLTHSHTHTQINM